MHPVLFVILMIGTLAGKGHNADRENRGSQTPRLKRITSFN